MILYYVSRVPAPRRLPEALRARIFRVLAACWKAGRSSSRYVLGEPHVNVILRLGVHEQDTVLASLFNHAYVNIVPFCALLLRLSVFVHQAGKEGSVALRVLRNEVKAHACGDPDGGPKKALLYTN